MGVVQRWSGSAATVVCQVLCHNPHCGRLVVGICKADKISSAYLRYLIAIVIPSSHLQDHIFVQDATHKMQKEFPPVQGGGSLILAWQIRNKNVLIVGGGEVSLATR